MYKFFSRLRFSFITASFVLSCLALISNAALANDSDSANDYKLETVVSGLNQPWAMAFLPNNDILVTERQGQLRIVLRA